MPEPIPYAPETQHLAQGDIFARHVVAPLVDDEIRILRTQSGLHGAHVFAGHPGHIFDYDHLVKTISSLPAAQQVPLFGSRDGIPLEMVVVLGDLVDYFIIASQTCDVSGVDSEPKPFATILPVVPLAAYLSRQRLPVGLSEDQRSDETKWSTIVDYLDAKLGEAFTDVREDVFALPTRVREVLRNWNPSKNAAERRVRGTMIDLLNKVLDPRKGFIYYLPGNVGLRVPEGYVDFTRLFSVVTGKLRRLAAHRVCSLATPYREQFASKLGLYLSRIATPVQLTPPHV